MVRISYHVHEPLALPDPPRDADGDIVIKTNGTLQVPGTLHMLNGATTELEHVMPHLNAHIEETKQVCNLVRRPFTKNDTWKL